MVFDACGPREAGSSDTPNLLDKRGAVAESLQHVGVPRQRPEAEVLVVIERRLVAQPLVVRVRVFVKVVVVRVEEQVADGAGLSGHLVVSRR